MTTTIDPARLGQIEAKLDAVLAALRGATVVPAPEWITIPEAAKRLGCSTDTIRRRVTNGSMQARGYGKLKRVKVG